MRVNANQIYNAARKLKPWTQRRATIPVLECVRLKAGDGLLELAATDLDTSASIDLLGAGTGGGEPWSVCINAQVLASTLHKLKGAGDVELTGTETELVIEAGARAVKLKGREVADFPQLPDVQGWETGLEAEDLVTAIGRVGYAMSREDSRFALQAFYFEARPTFEGRLVTTDGHRMAWADLPFNGPESPVLLPGAWIKVRGLGMAGSGVLRLSEHHCAYRQGGVEVTGRLVEGTFPDYQRIMVKDHPFWAEAPSKAWIEALKWAGSMTDKRNRGGVEVKSTGYEVVITARDPDKGESSEKLEASVAGEWRVRLNAAYLVEAIRALEPAERVKIRVTDENRQVGIVAETGESILMPVRL